MSNLAILRAASEIRETLNQTGNAMLTKLTSKKGGVSWKQK